MRDQDKTEAINITVPKTLLTAATRASGRGERSRRLSHLIKLGLLAERAGAVDTGDISDVAQARLEAISAALASYDVLIGRITDLESDLRSVREGAVFNHDRLLELASRPIVRQDPSQEIAVRPEPAPTPPPPRAPGADPLDVFGDTTKPGRVKEIVEPDGTRRWEPILDEATAAPTIVVPMERPPLPPARSAKDIL